MVSWLDRSFGRRHALRYLIEAPLRWRWHVLVPAALVFVATVAAGLLRPSRYRAVALVRVEQNAAGDAALESRGIDLAERRGRAVLQRVLERAALERLLRRAEFDPGARVPSSDEVDKWLDIVRVQPQGGSAFRIECIQPEATRAALIANLLATDLVEQTAPPDVEPDFMRPQLLEARLAEARRTMEDSQAALARLERTPTVSPKDRQRLAREHDRARTAHQALLEQWRAAEMATRLGHGPTARFELLRKASVPDRQEPPGLVLFAFAGGALGLALGLGVALLAEVRNQTVKGPEDLAKVLALPLLATIPLVRTGKPAPRRAIPGPARPRR